MRRSTLAGASALLLSACDGDIRLGALVDGGPGSGAPGDPTDAASATAPLGSCAAEGECPLALHCEVPRGRCVECRDDADCGSGDRRVCDLAAGRCVECRADSDCEDRERCELATRVCVDRCSVDRPCARGTCEQATGRCVECATDAECAPGACSATGTCVECTSGATCSPSEPKCDPLLSVCVACTGHADCPAGRFCQPSSGECKTP